MRQQMAILNVVLLVVALGLGIKLRGDWQRAQRRYAALGAATPPALPGAPAQAALAADWEVIAQRNLFSPDRNNELPKSAGEKQQPEPIVVGTMNLGPGRKLALMSEANPPAGTMPRQVKEGETFAGYRVVSIGDNEVEIEYEGQKKKLGVYISAQQVSSPPASASSPQVVSTGSVPAGPMNQSVTTLDANNELPAGTVVGDRRKVVTKTPWGNSISWEPVKPQEKKP